MIATPHEPVYVCVRGSNPLATKPLRPLTGGAAFQTSLDFKKSLYPSTTHFCFTNPHSKV